MEDGVALVEPAGLGVDEVGHRATGNRGRTIGDFQLVDMVGGSGALGIEKRALCGDLYGSVHGGDVEFDGIFGGKNGTYFDDAVVGIEALVLNSEVIEAEGEVTDNQQAGIVGRERPMELNRVVRKFSRRLNGKAIRIGNFEAKVSRAALSQE